MFPSHRQHTEWHREHSLDSRKFYWIMPVRCSSNEFLAPICFLPIPCRASSCCSVFPQMSNFKREHRAPGRSEIQFLCF